MMDILPFATTKLPAVNRSSINIAINKAIMLRTTRLLAPVTRRAVVATEAEIARNGRARSARLRIAEKTAAADTPRPEPPERRPGA